MKDTLEIEDILSNLNDEQILKLSIIFNSTYGDWNKVDHIQYARSVYLKTKSKHGGFIKLSNNCSIGKMMNLLNEKWFISINPPGSDSYYNFQLELSERKDCKDANDEPLKERYNGDELSDILLTAIKELILVDFNINSEGQQLKEFNKSNFLTGNQFKNISEEEIINHIEYLWKEIQKDYDEPEFNELTYKIHDETVLWINNEYNRASIVINKLLQLNKDAPYINEDKKEKTIVYLNALLNAYLY
jgi:hypothetical protein